jgi:hypothetical protein
MEKAEHFRFGANWSQEWSQAVQNLSLPRFCLKSTRLRVAISSVLSLKKLSEIRMSRDGICPVSASAGDIARTDKETRN